MSKPVTVYIPKENHPVFACLMPGSAIVADGQMVTPEDVLVYYEGNRYNDDALRAFGDRAVIAAGRLMERYPTIARGAFPVDLLLPVGTVELRKEEVPPEYRHYPKHVLKRFERRPRLTFIPFTAHAGALSAWCKSSDPSLH